MQEQAQQAVDCAEKPVRDAGRADGQHDSRGQQRAGRRDPGGGNRKEFISTKSTLLFFVPKSIDIKDKNKYNGSIKSVFTLNWYFERRKES